jgi:hypothetical protein
MAACPFKEDLVEFPAVTGKIRIPLFYGFDFH